MQLKDDPALWQLQYTGMLCMS